MAYRRYLLGQVHLLRQDHLALLQRTREIDILDLVTQVDRLFHQGDQAPFHLEGDGRTFLYLVEQSAAGFDSERLTSIRTQEC